MTTIINYCTFCDSVSCAHIPAFSPYNVQVVLPTDRPCNDFELRVYCMWTMANAPKVVEPEPVQDSEIVLPLDGYNDPHWLDRLEFGHRSGFRRLYGSI